MLLVMHLRILLLLHKVEQLKMLALIAVILAVLAAFNVHIADIALGWLALAFLAAHFVVPVVRDGTLWPR